MIIKRRLDAGLSTAGMVARWRVEGKAVGKSNATESAIKRR